MPDLAELLAARTEALARPRRQVPWSTLTPARRAEEQKTLRDVANAERAILAVLLASPGPVRVGDVVLHLTWDRLNFVELDRATGEPVWTALALPLPGEASGVMTQPILHKLRPRICDFYDGSSRPGVSRGAGVPVGGRGEG
jgi:hypothetical protein